MSEYTVPKDMGVAINKDALNEVVQEMGSSQPKFIRAMIDELQKEVDLQKAAIAEKDSTIAALQARIRELESGNSSDLPS